jgi:hypothetical protein
LSAISECDARAADEVGDGARGEDFVGLGEGLDALGVVDGVQERVAVLGADDTAQVSRYREFGLRSRVLSGECSQLRKFGLHIGNKAIDVGDGGRIGVDPEVARAGVTHHRHVRCCTDAGTERDDALDLGA